MPCGNWIWKLSSSTNNKYSSSRIILVVVMRDSGDRQTAISSSRKYSTSFREDKNSCLEGANKIWYIGVCTYIERRIIYRKTKLVRTMIRGSTETVQTVSLYGS